MREKDQYRRRLFCFFLARDLLGYIVKYPFNFGTGSPLFGSKIENRERVGQECAED
jgi:hypothetical protein